jgi:hypothetical protein
MWDSLLAATKLLDLARMTSSEDPPVYFIFVNHGNPLARMNYEITGSFFSTTYAALGADERFIESYPEGNVDYLPFVPNEDMATGFMSPFLSGVMNDYRVEFDAEVCRRTRFAHPAVSPRVGIRLRRRVEL